MERGRREGGGVCWKTGYKGALMEERRQKEMNGILLVAETVQNFGTQRRTVCICQTIENHWCCVCPCNK